MNKNEAQSIVGLAGELWTAWEVTKPQMLAIVQSLAPFAYDAADAIVRDQWATQRSRREPDWSAIFKRCRDAKGQMLAEQRDDGKPRVPPHIAEKYAGCEMDKPTSRAMADEIDRHFGRVWTPRYDAETEAKLERLYQGYRRGESLASGCREFGKVGVDVRGAERQDAKAMERRRLGIIRTGATK